MTRTLLALVAVALLAPGAAAQGVSNEYRVKAAFLYNFFKYVEWPPASPQDGPLMICVAGRNVFGNVLEETIQGETLNGRPMRSRVLLEPERGCHILFVPDGAAASVYLRAAQGMPVLTVGERPGFIEAGGIVRFFVSGGNVKFAINPAAAERAKLRISARLLQLADIAQDQPEAP